MTAGRLYTSKKSASSSKRSTRKSFLDHIGQTHTRLEQLLANDVGGVLLIARGEIRDHWMRRFLRGHAVHGAEILLGDAPVYVMTGDRMAFPGDFIDALLGPFRRVLLF